MEAKHTGGTWNADHTAETKQPAVYNAWTRICVCDSPTTGSATTSSEAEANALLIAAAPELLEVLKRYLDAAAQGLPQVNRGTYLDALNAIAKAEGRI